MKKILVIRFSSMGDVIITSAVLRCLKKQVKCEIHFITKKQYKALLLFNPFVEKIITIKNGIDEVKRKLKQENYDLIIDLHKNIRSFQLKKYLDVNSISYNKQNLKKWIWVKSKINLLSKEHLNDRYFSSLKSLSLSYDNLGLDFFIDPNIDSNELLKTFHLEHQKYIAINISATHVTKRIPINKCVDIIEKLDMRVVLLGGKDVMKNGKKISKKALKLHKPVINLCGILDIHETATFIKNAELIITGDTGLMHMAAALNKKMIVIWGSTDPGFGLYPLYPADKETYKNIAFDELKCRPCTKIGFEACPLGHLNCLKLISTDQIISEMNELLLQN